MLRQLQIYKFVQQKCRHFADTMASKIGLEQADSLACGREVLEFVFLYRRNKLC